MRLVMSLLAVAMLAACNDKPPAKTVFDPQLQTMERARGVEREMQQAEQRRALEVEQQERANE